MNDEIYKRPESVLVVIYTLQGMVLLLRRTHPPWFWQSVTGSLKRGESPRRAAAREVYEETGLQVRGNLIDAHRGRRFRIISPWRTRYAPDVRFNSEHWFYLPLVTHPSIRLNPQEHADCRWLPLLQAARRVSSWTNRDAILSLASPSPAGLSVHPVQPR